MTSRLDPYTVLGIPRTASSEEVKQAYQEKSTDSPVDSDLHRAYSILSDQDRREAYDGWNQSTGSLEEESFSEAHTPAPSPEDLNDILEELVGLVGLAPVKQEVSAILALAALQQKRSTVGLATKTLSNHMVFVGPPGTGKTTVARLVGRALHSMGLLSTGHFIEVDRGDLVGEYIGHTAVKTSQAITSALGGVLFIDEAYALHKELAGDHADFGREAIETLMKRMEDERENLVVIVAGYPQEMEQFLESNPGLSSRFTRTVEFPDYTPSELVEILHIMAEEEEYRLAPAVVEKAEDLLWAAHAGRTRSFGNARTVRNILEGAIRAHAARLFDIENPTYEQLETLQPEDLPDVLDRKELEA